MKFGLSLVHFSFLFLCASALSDEKANHDKNSPHPKTAITSPDLGRWEGEKWIGEECVEAAVGKEVTDLGMHLFASSLDQKEGTEIRFCYGGEEECRSKDSWILGKPRARDNGKSSSYLSFSMKSGQPTLITIESKDKDGTSCYRSVSVARMEDKGFVLAVADKTMTLAKLETPPLPKVEKPSELEVKMKEINAFRAEKTLPPIPSDEKTIAEYRANAQPGIDAINRERKRFGRAPVEFDFICCAIARTNNDLPNQPVPRGTPSFYGYAHKYTAGTAQVWAQGHAKSEDAVNTWVNHDGEWNNAHQAIVLGGYTKVGFAMTKIRGNTDYSADFR